MLKDKVLKIIFAVLVLMVAGALFMTSGFVFGYRLGKENPQNIIGITERAARNFSNRVKTKGHRKRLCRKLEKTRKI